MKTKIVQYFIGDDPEYLKICQLTKQFNSKYCQLHDYGYNFTLLSQQEMKKQWNSTFQYYKLKFMYDSLVNNQDYDYIAIIDADAAVSNPNIKIEDLVDNQHELFLSRGNQRWEIIRIINNLHYELGIILSDQKNLFNPNIEEIFNKPEIYEYSQKLSLTGIRYNEGFFIIKNTQNMRQFFKDCLFFFNFYISHTVKISQPQEGRTISFMLQLKKYHSLYTFLYDHAQSGHANRYEYKFDIDKTFILHNYGYALSKEQKIEIFTQMKNSKWWKPYFEKEQINEN